MAAAPTCSWGVTLDGDPDPEVTGSIPSTIGAALAARVRLLRPRAAVSSGDGTHDLEKNVHSRHFNSNDADGDVSPGAFERWVARHCEDGAGRGLRLRRSRAQSGGPRGAFSCELTVPLPTEGASSQGDAQGVSAVCVVSTSRTVELYALHPSLPNGRAYVRTVRGTAVGGGGKGAGSNPAGIGGDGADERVNKRLDFEGVDEEAEEEADGGGVRDVKDRGRGASEGFFECSTTLSALAQPCAAVLVKLFAAPDGPAEVRLRGVVVELRGGTTEDGDGRKGKGKEKSGGDDDATYDDDGGRRNPSSLRSSDRAGMLSVLHGLRASAARIGGEGDTGDASGGRGAGSIPAGDGARLPPGMAEMLAAAMRGENGTRASAPPPALMAMLRRASEARDEASDAAAAAAAAARNVQGSKSGRGCGDETDPSTSALRPVARGGRRTRRASDTPRDGEGGASDESAHSSDDDDATLGRRVRRIERVVTRLEEGVFSMFEALNARLSAMEERVDKVLSIHGKPFRARSKGGHDGGVSPTHGTPRTTPWAHTKAEWNSSVKKGAPSTVV